MNDFDPSRLRPQDLARCNVLELRAKIDALRRELPPLYYDDGLPSPARCREVAQQLLLIFGDAKLLRKAVEDKENDQGQAEDDEPRATYNELGLMRSHAGLVMHNATMLRDHIARAGNS